MCPTQPGDLSLGKQLHDLKFGTHYRLPSFISAPEAGNKRPNSLKPSQLRK